MRITHRLAGDRPEPEALVDVIGCGLEAAIVEGKRFPLRAFQIELAIVGAGERVGDEALRRFGIQSARARRSWRSVIGGGVPSRGGLFPP